MRRTLLAMVIVLPLILGALGCGKKGPPVPPPNRAHTMGGVSH
jgi:predicted small lipoprotein YifL